MCLHIVPCLYVGYGGRSVGIGRKGPKPILPLGVKVYYTAGRGGRPFSCLGRQPIRLTEAKDCSAARGRRLLICLVRKTIQPPGAQGYSAVRGGGIYDYPGRKLIRPTEAETCSLKELSYFKRKTLT